MNAAEIKALTTIAERAIGGVAYWSGFGNGVRRATLRNLEAKGLITIASEMRSYEVRINGFCGNGDIRKRFYTEYACTLTEAGREALQKRRL